MKFPLHIYLYLKENIFLCIFAHVFYMQMFIFALDFVNRLNANCNEKHLFRLFSNFNFHKSEIEIYMGSPSVTISNNTEHMAMYRENSTYLGKDWIRKHTLTDEIFQHARLSRSCLRVCTFMCVYNVHYSNSIYMHAVIHWNRSLALSDGKHTAPTVHFESSLWFQVTIVPAFTE